MKFKSVFLPGIIAIFAAAAFAQSSSFQENQAINRSGPSDEISRPRIVEEKAAEVKASVIVNILANERIAFELLNQKRAENGLKALVWSDEVAAVARQHSRDMAEFKYFSHRGLDGSMVSDRADRLGLKKWSSIGENIAFNRGYKDPIEKAVELWMGSSSHRHNLMSNDWKESAVGIAIAPDGSYYLTQVFITRK